MTATIQDSLRYVIVHQWPDGKLSIMPPPYRHEDQACKQAIRMAQLQIEAGHWYRPALTRVGFDALEL